MSRRGRVPDKCSKCGKCAISDLDNMQAKTSSAMRGMIKKLNDNIYQLRQ